MPELVIAGFAAIEAAPGASLLEICDAHALPMGSDCGGFAACNACRVEVLEGAENLSPRSAEEESFLDHDGQRLGCQARLLGRVAVRLDPGT